jgi:preprotein translocase subunit SecA
MIGRLNKDPGGPITFGMFTRFVASAQKRIEGSNYDARKTVLKYDDVMRQQREIVYKLRRDTLVSDSVENVIIDYVNQTIDRVISPYIVSVGKNKYDIDDKGICKALNGIYFDLNTFDEETLQDLDEVEINNLIHEKAIQALNDKKDNVPDYVYSEFLKIILLRTIDQFWMKHIDTMSELRQSVMLQSYAQVNPLYVYQNDGLKLFKQLMIDISDLVCKYAIRARLNFEQKREAVVKNTRTNEGSTEVRKRQHTSKGRNSNRKPWQR